MKFVDLSENGKDWNEKYEFCKSPASKRPKGAITYDTTYDIIVHSKTEG